MRPIPYHRRQSGEERGERAGLASRRERDPVEYDEDDEAWLTVQEF